MHVGQQLQQQQAPLQAAKLLQDFQFQVRDHLLYTVIYFFYPCVFSVFVSYSGIFIELLKPTLRLQLFYEYLLIHTVLLILPEFIISFYISMQKFYEKTLLIKNALFDIKPNNVMECI